jgi:hypothetical protein
VRCQTVDTIAGRFEQPQAFNDPDGASIGATECVARHRDPLSVRAAAIVPRAAGGPSVLAETCDTILSLATCHLSLVIRAF